MRLLRLAAESQYSPWLESFMSKWKAKGVDSLVSYWNVADVLTLHKLVVPKEQRGHGLGTEFMKELTAFADSQKLTIVLTPDKVYGGSVSRLKKFYKEFGFVENKGRNKDFTYSEGMLRRPK